MIKMKKMMSLVLALVMSASLFTNWSTPVFAVENEPTLTFVPAGVTPAAESLGTEVAYVANDTVTVYEYYENGSKGMVCTGALGEQIELTKKFTYTAEGVETVIYHFADSDFAGVMGAADDANYQFILASDVTFTAPEVTPTPEPAETVIPDTETGVSVSGDLPDDVTLTVTSKLLAESGIDTIVYPINGASLFYDVTLYQNSAEYQPENGVTITLPESAVTGSGLQAGDYYKVYHIHDDVTDVTGPYEYIGGNIEVTFSNLSVVGISESTIGVNLTDLFGAYVSEENYYAWATIASDTVDVYGAVNSDSTDIYSLTGVDGVDVEVIKKATYKNGVLYQIAYRGDDTEIQNIFSNVNNYFIPETYLLLTCTCNCGKCTGTFDCTCCESCTCSEDVELQPTYGSLMETGCLADFEELFESLDEATQTKLQESSYWTEIQQHNYHLVYSHFYSVGTEDEFNAIKTAYPEAWNYIQNDSTLKQYNDLHLERIRYVAENPEIELELGDERIPVTYPSYTHAAGLVEVPTAATAASYLENGGISTFSMIRNTRATTTFESAADALTDDSNNNGIVLKKTIKDDYDSVTGTGTIRLEAYATGSKVTSVTTKQLPADIILVLDLSGSMDSHMDNMVYVQVESGTAQHLYHNYGSEHVFVQIDGEYREVTITGTGTATETYNIYEKNSNYNNNNYNTRNIAQALDGGTILYHYVTADNAYYPVNYRDFGHGDNKTYTFYYTKNDQEILIIERVNRDTDLSGSIYPFYTKSATTSYSSYTFSYTGVSDQTVTKTYAATDSVVGGDNPTYCVLEANGSIRKSTALVNAVQAFSDQVAAKAQGDTSTGEDDVKHHVAIVGFCGSNTADTGIYIGETIYKYGDEANAVYGSALQDMSNSTGVANVNGAIGKLFTVQNTSGTHTYRGTEMAYGILDAYDGAENTDSHNSRYVNEKGETIRTKVVVVFTDGSPNGTDAYNAPIYDCYQMKQKGATVYTVGILDDGSVTPIPPTSQLNQYMHYMSSNYQNAQSMIDHGDFTNTQYEIDGSSYYLLASNANDLNNIFSTISSSATSGGSSSTLTESAEVRDLISPYFQLPNGADEDDILVYTSEYKYDDVKGVYWDTPVTYDAMVEVNEKYIEVSNFDYSQYWVGTETAANDDVTYRGKKLIIEVPFTVEENFLGGDDVITNGSDFAIYDSDESTEALETVKSPIVDINLKPITNVAKDKHIYYTNTTDLTGILDLYIDVDGTEESNLRVVADGVNNAYVNLVYDVTVILDGESTETYTYTVPAGTKWEDGTWSGSSIDLKNLILEKNTRYSVKCIMTSKNNSTKKSETTDAATIYVYKPELTFEDTRKNPYSESVNYAGENYISESWKRDDNTLSTTVIMEGSKPVLTLSYTPDENCVNDEGLVISNKDFHVNVVVKIGERDVTVNTTFNHTDCNPADCGFDKGKGKFMIHIRTGDLKITKTGWNTTDENQSFIFDVTGPDGFKITVTINGNGEVTIKDLPLGEYTVTERTDWSWRYTPAGDNGKGINLIADGKNTVTFENNRSWNYWLSGDNYIENQFMIKQKDENN